MKLFKRFMIFFVFFLVGCRNGDEGTIIDIEGTLTINEEGALNPVTGITVYDVPMDFGDVVAPIHHSLTEDLIVSRIFQDSVNAELFEVINRDGVSLIQDSTYQYIVNGESNRIIVSSNYFYTMFGPLNDIEVAVNNFSYGYLIYNPDSPDDELVPMYSENNERFAYAGTFYDDAAVVGVVIQDQLKFGVIDLTGNYIIEPIYDFIHTTIINHRVIVANKVTLYIPDECMINDMKQVSYFSDEIGVIDLVTKEMVIPQTYDVVSWLDDDHYFVYDRDETNGIIINLKTQTQTVVYEPYVNMLPYNQTHYLGIAGSHIYLVDQLTWKPVAYYDRYESLLTYFGIVGVPNGTYYEYEEGDFAYNFNFTNPYPRAYDFIQNGGYFVVSDLENLPTKEQPTYKLINHLGEMLFEFPDTTYVKKGYYIKDTYIPVMIAEHGHGYYNSEGVLVEADFHFVSMMTGGVSIVGKLAEHSDGQYMDYYTYYQADGTLVAINFGIDHSTQTANVIEIIPGLYFLTISGDGYHHNHLVNTFGNVLLEDIQGFYQGSLYDLAQSVTDVPITDDYYHYIVGIDPLYLAPSRIIVLTRSALDNNE